MTGLLSLSVERLDDLDDASFEPEEEELAVDDRVKILNNHKGLKGKEATVFKITDYYVWIVLDDKDKPFKKKKTNVEKM